MKDVLDFPPQGKKKEEKKVEQHEPMNETSSLPQTGVGIRMERSGCLPRVETQLSSEKKKKKVSSLTPGLLMMHDGFPTALMTLFERLS